MAARRPVSSAARNSSVVRYGVAPPTSRARSLVIFPLSTVSMHTRSSRSANAVTSGVRRVVERDLTEQELAALRTAAEAVRAKQADVASL